MRAITCFVLLVSSVGNASSTLIRVPQDRDSIREGIDAAAPGDTVLVAPGTYVESGISYLGRAIVVTSAKPTDPEVVAATVVRGFRDAGDPTVEDGIFDSHPRWPRFYPNGARSDMGSYGGPENRAWLKSVTKCGDTWR